MRSALHSVIVSKIRRSDADLVCFQFGTLAAELGRDIVRIEKPFCLFHHGSDVNRAREDEDYRRRLVDVWEHAEKIFFVSEFLRRVAIGLGAPATKCEVRYLGVPLPERTTCSSSEERKDSTFRFVSLARMVPVKNHRILVQGFARFLQRSETLSELLLIGSGEEEAAVRNEVQRLGIEKWVRFAGAMESTRAMEELSHSDVIVLVSRIYRIPGTMLQEEALGISLLEGAIRGLPMIGAKTGGIPEIVRDGETGFLVDPNDPESIAEAMLRMAHEPELRKKMGENAQKMTRESFDILDRMKQIENDLISLAEVP